MDVTLDIKLFTFTFLTIKLKLLRCENVVLNVWAIFFGDWLLFWVELTRNCPLYKHRHNRNNNHMQIEQ